MGIKNLHWYLGYNSLALITEQERKHWLMKTDKRKQMIDPVTGDQYQGQIDNIGSDIIIETEKLPTKHSTLMNLSLIENLKYIFSLEPSAFTYCSQVNNFNFLRITSINYPTAELLEDVDVNELASEDVSYKNYRIRFDSVRRVMIPFGGSNASEDVFATTWIRTKNVYLELLDQNGSYVTEVQIKFNESDDIYFYYPLTQSLQTVPIEYIGNGKYQTLAINDNQYIGYPMLWFNLPVTMDQGNMGCWAECYEYSSLNRQLVLIGNPGNSTIYTGKVYVGVDGSYDATPEDEPTSEVYMTCTPVGDGKFTDSEADFLIPVKNVITMGDRDLTINYNGETTKFFMCKDVGWEFVDNTTYRVLMSQFDSNCADSGMNPLTAALTIEFDQSLNADYVSTIDIGVTGIRANSGNQYSDMYKAYPYDLNKWDGLPEHLQNIDDNHVPEHMAIYAIHNTPNYIPEIPESRQVAALLLDLGVKPDDRYDFYYHYRGRSGELPESDVPSRYLIQASRYTYSKYVDEKRRKPEIAELYPKWEDWLYGTLNSYQDYLSDPTRYQLGSGTYIDTDEEPEVEVSYDDTHPIQKEKYFEEIVRGYINGATEVMEEYAFPIRDIIYGIKMLEYPDKSDINAQIIHCYGYSDEHEGDYNIFDMTIYGLQFNSAGKLIGLDGNWTTTFISNGGVSADDPIIHVTRVEEAASDGSGIDIKIPSFSFDMYKVSDTDIYGRVYMLSNDDAEYINNASTSYPKPDRTVARICDIPTSISQLTGISGIAPTSVVDPKYTRTEANYTEDDKDRLYNKLASRWVRPIHARISGKEPTSDNDYVFTSLSDLLNVDLKYQNDFRYLSNLNPKVDPMTVTAGSIINGGSGYTRGDIGFIYIGGFAFEYEVVSVSTTSAVSKFTVRPVYTVDQSLEYDDIPYISLSNFDFSTEGSGFTAAYGTAPKTGKGKGFRCTLFIDNIESYKPIKGEIFDDLFALLRATTGLWIYKYNTNTERWDRSTQIAEFDSKNPESIYQTITDAYMATVVPRRHTLPVNRYDNGLSSVEDIDVLSTTTFVNILDTERSPIQENPTDNDNLTHVDLCKFRCDGFTRLQSSNKTFESAMVTVKTNLKVPADCYLAFRWEDYDNAENLAFYVGFIKRSFNNILVESDIAIIPENKLRYPYLFNSNPATTIVWDVKGVGPMMWTFNPNSQIHEKYIIDPDRRTFYIDKEQLTWDKIDIYSANKSEQLSLIDKDGNIMYDIYTNSLTAPYVEEHIGQDEIYDQPEFYKIVERGTANDAISNFPTGNWSCIFPRVSGFVFENEITGSTVIPVQMQMVHGANVVRTSKLYNKDTGFDESQRTVIFEDTVDDGVRLRVFNSETSTWDTV